MNVMEEIEEILSDPIFGEGAFQYWKNHISPQKDGKKFQKPSFKKVDLKDMYMKLKKTGTLPENMSYKIYKQTWGRIFEEMYK